MKRRNFIGMCAGAAVGGFVPVGTSAWAAVSGVGPSQDAPRRLVVVFLRGAVDGLSIVVPYSDNEYYQLRSSIAIPRPGNEGGAIDLDGRFGLHPALAPLMPLWTQGSLAFVTASGSPDATRSHFDAQDYMESGTPGYKATQDGWMNRMLGSLPPTGNDPMRGVSVGPTLPRIYAGPMEVANIPNGGGASRPTVLDKPGVESAFAQMYQGDDRLSRAYQDARASHKEVIASMDSAETEKEMAAASNGAPSPNGFPNDAAHLATLMRRNPHVQLAFLALGGWDTHANQGNGKGQLANRLAPLGVGLAALANGLGPVYQDTTILVISEFGRTAHQNGNGGTDHGHGNVMWVLGGGVNGGKIYGEWPGLGTRDLYEGRDVAVTTDFRGVLAQVAERHMQVCDNQLATVFPRFSPSGKKLDLMRA